MRKHQDEALTDGAKGMYRQRERARATERERERERER
jgi:hypothetical protein